MQDTITVLNRLVQTDIDALHCYDQAISRIREGATAGVLRAFRIDHDRHVEELSEAVRGLGGTPPSRQDASGRMLSGMTAVAASTGTLSALTIMEANEVVTNRAYEQALAADLPTDLRALVAANRDDERRHLARIKDMLGEYGATGRAMRLHGAMEGRMASLWMNSLRYHPWSLLLVAGAAGVLAATLWPRRGEIASGVRQMAGQARREDLKPPPPPYPPRAGDGLGQPLH